MNCPGCKQNVDFGGAVVVDSRPSDARIRRRRKCVCGHRFTTYETIGGDAPTDQVLRSLDRLARIVSALAEEIERLRREASGGHSPPATSPSPLMSEPCAPSSGA